MSNIVRVGVVGMGIGRPNARAIAANPRGQIAALCDIKEERMQEFAKELKGDVKMYTSFSEMCRDKEIDAVFIGTPNQMHVPMALEAIKHDKHVMVTKPLADCEAAAKKVVQVAESAGVVNMMSLSTRFSENCRFVGKLAEKNHFGELYYARARSVRRSGIPAWNMGFIEKGGGAFRDMGVHVLDAAWWLLGMPNPVSVTGVAGAKFGPRGQGYFNYENPGKKVSKRYAADDYAGGFIRFENGTGLQVESFWACHQPDEFQIELFGTQGGAKCYPVTLFRTANGAPEDVTVKPPKSGEAWDHIAANFIDSILGETKCQAPLRHGLIVQQMMEALLLSAKTGKEVRM